MKAIKSISLVIFSLVFFSLGFATQSKAQVADKISYSIDAGVGIPAGPYSFTQNWNTGYGLGAGVSYEVQPSVMIQLYGQYYRFGLDEKGVRDNSNSPQTITGINDVTAETFQIMLNFIYEYKLPQVATTPYFSLGSGYFKACVMTLSYKLPMMNLFLTKTAGQHLALMGR